MPNYSGTWALPAQMQAIGSGNWPVNGPYWIDDVFSTYLYTGNGSTQTITNGIDLSTKGGLVWIKSRTQAFNNSLMDSNRGSSGGYYKYLYSNLTNAETTGSYGITSFNTNGFSLGSSGTQYNTNNSSEPYASWTFRKQAKFFDVVTYTGTGSPRTVAHNLGSTPGLIIVKRLNLADAWQVYHRSLGATKFLFFGTSAAQTDSTVWNDTEPTSTVFTVGTEGRVNSNGGTYVAYLFAHDAGGFGTSGTDNVISCGSYVDNTTGTISVNLGYEPQWILAKPATSVNDWFMVDVMRGDSVTSAQYLYANKSNAEMGPNIGLWYPTATGFSIPGSNSGDTWIYIAIRRPMKPPTTGTSVYNAITYSGSGSDVTKDLGFVADAALTMPRTFSGFTAWDRFMSSRLTGNRSLITNDSSSEGTGNVKNWGVSQTEVDIYANYVNTSGFTYVLEAFRRAPGFFDVVCYTGDGTNNRPITHNLGVAPELAIVKQRNQSNQWLVWQKDLFISGGGLQKNLRLNSASEQDYYPFSTNSSSGDTNYPSPTATTINVGGTYTNQSSSVNYVMYLFATCAGVSKVGSYTGTGGTFTVNCGFTGGARFVLIKRTDSTGNWYVWDTARGMVAGTDPKLALNTTDAESNANWVYTATTGFQVVGTDASINANGGSYIYLAVA